jgi:hypothetical protein
MPASAIISGPFICGFPALAMWANGTQLPFGAVMEFAINPDGIVRPPTLALALALAASLVPPLTPAPAADVQAAAANAM